MTQRDKTNAAAAKRNTERTQIPIATARASAKPATSASPEIEGKALLEVLPSAEVQTGGKPKDKPLSATSRPGNSQPTSAPTPPVPAQQAAFQLRVYQPIDIACPHQNNDLTNCGAQAGEPCSWQQSGMEGTYHAERVADADAASQRDGNKPTQEQFDQAAYDSGLF